jgi:transposase
MARPPAVPPEEKTRLVLAILAGEMTIAEAARRAKVSEQSVSNWKRLFLESGRQGLAEGGKPGPNSRERQLLSELEEVKAALGEAHVELRVWKRSAEYLPPSKTSR